MTKALEVANLSAGFRYNGAATHAISDVSFSIDAGETLCLVGESGSGKTLTGLSTLGLLPSNCAVTQGSIKVGGREIVGRPEAELTRLRGREIAMVFQDPMSSLNPSRTIGWQMAEALGLSHDLSAREKAERAVELLERTGIPRARARLQEYPHELSGGLRQRVMIAMALSGRPRVLIADEPTTALDVTVQDQILFLLEDLKAEYGMAMLLVTHDMGVVARVADRVEVMYAGRIVESASSTTLFSAPAHRYTRSLLASVPRLDTNRSTPLQSIEGAPPELGAIPAGCAFNPRCGHALQICRESVPVHGGSGGHTFACWNPAGDEPFRGVSDLPAPELDSATSGLEEPAVVLQADALSKEFLLRRARILTLERPRLSAVSEVSLTIQQGETFGLVGESGCGKTTLAKMIAGLTTPSEGRATVLTKSLVESRRKDAAAHRRTVQMMFQDPYSSLDPRLRISSILEEPLSLQRVGSKRERREIVERAIQEVGMPLSALDRLPHEFSGGQRQRIGLARALILRPKLVVADEPVSALDMSIRSQILNLMKRVQEAHRLAYLLISHDLTVIKYLADRVGVMYLGKLVEVAHTDVLFRSPAHPYTRALLDAILVPDPAAMLGRTRKAVDGEIPSPVDPPSGCRFRTRCPRAEDICATEPPLRAMNAQQQVACHFPLEATG